MRGRSLGLAGVFGLTLVLLGGCPQPPTNDNGNSNSAANTNANTSANANENASANTNENGAANTNENATANQNENGAANQNQNSSANTNENAPANGNDNATQNANDNSSANTNSNSNSNTNANDNSGGGGALTANQQAAVNGAVLRLKALDTIIGVLIPMTNALLELPDPTAINITGSCPELGWAATVSSAAIGVIYDDNTSPSAPGFGAGCTNPESDNLAVAGQVAVSYTNATSTGVIDYQTMTIAGESVTTNGTMVIIGGGLDGTGPLPLAYNGSFGGNVAGDEQFSGNIAFVIRNPVGTVDPALITINAAGYTLGQNGQTSFAVDLANVVVDVLGNSSFTPESGTLTFTPAGESQIVITFTAASPAGGTVQVSVGGGAAVAHTVPGAAG